MEGDKLKTLETKVPDTLETPKKAKSDCYEKCSKDRENIFAAFEEIGETDVSLEHRIKIASANEIPTSNTSIMNADLLNTLKSGKLKRV